MVMLKEQMTPKCQQLTTTVYASFTLLVHCKSAVALLQLLFIPRPRLMEQLSSETSLVVMEREKKDGEPNSAQKDPHHPTHISLTKAVREGGTVFQKGERTEGRNLEGLEKSNTTYQRLSSQKLELRGGW